MSLLSFLKPNKKIYPGMLRSFIYCPGYCDMRGAIHREELSMTEKGDWIITCADREDCNDPLARTVYPVSTEAVERFEAYILENNIADLSNRKESNDFVTDYCPWYYEINYDMSSSGGSSLECIKIVEFRMYSAQDRELLKAFVQQYKSLKVPVTINKM